jgi:mitochondrial fission protein ELM1
MRKAEGPQTNEATVQCGAPPLLGLRAARRFSAAYARPPRAVPAAIFTTTIFLGIAVVISRIIGTRLALPHSGEIPGLGTSYWIPPLAAAAGYLLLQSVMQLIRRPRRSWREIARHALDDYLLLGVFILVICIHFNIKMWIPLINPELYDHDYYAIDEAARPILAFLGEVRGLIGRVSSAEDIWYQAAFFSAFVLSFLAHALGDRRFHYANMLALLFIETVGPLTYLIAPAVGPFIFEHGPNALATAAELQMYEGYRQVLQGGADWINAHGSEYFALPLAAMPSLHVGATFIILYYAVRARSWMSPFAALAFGWIVIESVVARWHYLIDLPVGLLLAVAAIAVASRLCSREAGPAAPRMAREISASGRTATIIAPEWLHRREPDALAGVRSSSEPVVGDSQPRIWILKCHRAGDHAQSLALAQALGWPFEVKKTRFHWYELFFALAGCATLAGLHRRRSSALQPPWPDLIILAGRQNETPAKWIRKQSGGRTRIVVIGRYWTPPAELDFVVTTPQFRLPAHPNVLHNSFPLHLVTKTGLKAAAAKWGPKLDGLPGPYVTLLVGGSSGPYVFSRATARRLGREASALARSLGASLLVSTSARTGRAAMAALDRAIEVPCRFYRWRKNDPDNPYLGFLAVADRIIVTGDSMSMLAEACSTGRPVHIFEFGGGPAAMRGPRSANKSVRQWWRWSQLKDQGVLGLPYAWAIGLPAWRLNRSRDIRLIQDHFIASGRATWLGDKSGRVARPAPLDDLDRAVARIRALMHMEPSPDAAPDGHGASRQSNSAGSLGLATARVRRSA